LGLHDFQSPKLQVASQSLNILIAANQEIGISGKSRLQKTLVFLIPHLQGIRGDGLTTFECLKIVAMSSHLSTPHREFFQHAQTRGGVTQRLSEPGRCPAAADPFLSRRFTIRSDCTQVSAIVHRPSMKRWGRDVSQLLVRSMGFTSTIRRRHPRRGIVWFCFE